MIREPFVDGTSWIHRMDPGLRIVCATAFAVVAAVASGYATLAMALVTAAALVMAAGLPWKTVLRHLLPLAAFLALIWALVPFTYGGETMGTWGPLHISAAGVALCVRITMKSTAIVLSMMALVGTIRIANIGHALEGLRVPAKLIFLLLMTYRYIFVIETEYHRLQRAAKIRGFRPKTSLHTYRTFAYFLGVLFIRASSRAERVAQAMKCRGFNGRYYCLCEYPRHAGNWWFGGAMAAAVAAMAAMEWIPPLQRALM